MNKIVLLGLLLLAGCNNPNSADGLGKDADTKLLTNLGYTDIQLFGYAPFKCGNDDNMMFTDKFTATAPNGMRVTGVICGDFFKGKTIRY